MTTTLVSALINVIKVYGQSRCCFWFNRNMDELCRSYPSQDWHVSQVGA
jgi:hypothetical protein